MDRIDGVMYCPREYREKTMLENVSWRSTLRKSMVYLSVLNKE